MHTTDLRAWAKGSYTLEAATELLIRAFDGRYAEVGRPWVRADDGHPWIDFESIPDFIGGSSSGERRFLMLAASLAADVPVVIGDLVAGLDRENLDLVLAAIAHAGGSHEHSDVRESNGSVTVHGMLDSLHPWPLKLRSL